MGGIFNVYIGCLMQDCSISIAAILEIIQSCIKPLCLEFEA